MNKQFVIVEYNNCGPFVYEILSKSPITIDTVAEYFIDTEGWNEERDNITFTDKPTKIEI